MRSESMVRKFQDKEINELDLNIIFLKAPWMNSKNND